MVDKHNVLEPFHAQYIPALIRDDLYYPDGQIKEEVFVYGSFIQSKMFQAGVQCMDCHKPHSLKLVLPGNQVCTQCHDDTPKKRFKSLVGKRQNYDSFQHTHHPKGSQGSLCVSCHMPQTTYMQIDPRRDHAFKVPNPELTIQFGIPNACNRCHKEKSPEWSKEWLIKWFGRTYQNTPVLLNDEQALLNIYYDDKSPDIFKASALSLLNPAKAKDRKACIRGLKENSALVKKAGLDCLSKVKPRSIKPVLSPLLLEKNRVLQSTAASILAGTGIEDKDLEQFKHIQRINNDLPESDLNLAGVSLKQHQTSQAELQLKEAINKDPHFVPAYLLLAQLYGLQHKPKKSLAILMKGRKSNPNSASLYYSIALEHMDRREFKLAEAALSKCLKLDAHYPRATQNLSLVLWKLGQWEKAQSLINTFLAQNPSDKEAKEISNFLKQNPPK